jgi:serine O-acetyltransferase
MDDEASPPDKKQTVYRPDGKGPFALLDAAEVMDAPRSWRSMIDLMKSDAARLRYEYPDEPIVYRFYPILLTSWSYRLSHTLRRRGHKISPVIVMWLCFFLTGAQINPSAVIGPGFLCIHPQTINIGGGVIMGKNCKLQGVNSFGAVWRPSRTRQEVVPGSPRIGDDVLFNNQASAFGPVWIGDRVEVGAYSMVIHDCPDDAVVKGVPAR